MSPSSMERRGVHIVVTWQFLHGPNVVAVFKQVLPSRRRIFAGTARS